jgi:hypothetical protein
MLKKDWNEGLDQALKMFEQFQHKKQFINVDNNDLDFLKKEGELFYGGVCFSDSLLKALKGAMEGLVDRSSVSGAIVIFFGEQHNLKQMVDACNYFYDEIDGDLIWGAGDIKDQKSGALVIFSRNRGIGS